MPVSSGNNCRAETRLVSVPGFTVTELAGENLSRRLVGISNRAGSTLYYKFSDEEPVIGSLSEWHQLPNNFDFVEISPAPVFSVWAVTLAAADIPVLEG